MTDIPAPFASRAFELEAVAGWIRKVNPRQVYLEIGSFQGGATANFGRIMAPGATLIAVDKPTSSQPGAVVLRGVIAELCEEGYDAVVVLGDSKSLAVQDTVRHILGGRSVDVLFIDGDHSSKGVTADSNNYVPMVRPGGLVVFHDLGPRLWMKRSRGVIDAVWPVWFALASKNLRNATVQQHCGYGMVWIDE